MNLFEIDLVAQAVPAVVSTLALAVLSFTARRVVKIVGCMAAQFQTIVNAQRDQLKTQIVDKYENGKRRGYITPMELDVTNHMADSYFALQGNHYIKSIMHRLNEKMEVKGDGIPE